MLLYLFERSARILPGLGNAKNECMMFCGSVASGFSKLTNNGQMISVWVGSFIVLVELAWWFGQELGLVFVGLVGWACVNIVLCGLCAMSQAAASLEGVHVRIVPDAQEVGS